MSTELYIFTMLTHFAGYESVHFGVHYAAKSGPTGVDAYPGDDALPGDGWYPSPLPPISSIHRYVSDSTHSTGIKE